MRIIDAHVHVLSTYEPMDPFPDTGRVDRLLYLMDDAGVEKAVMLPVVAPFSPENNADCARWAREHADRLATMTDVALHETDAAERVARAREAYDCVAISYYPNSADIAWMLDEERAPLWQSFVDSGLVCNLQVTPPNYGTLLTLAQRYPNVPFLCNHLGLPSSLDPADVTYGGLDEAAALDNVFVKASAFYAAANTSWDPRCARALGYFTSLVNALGAERILWGTDWPPTSRNLTYRQALEVVRAFAPTLDDEQRAHILGANAAHLLGI
ncbi:MAG: amidohydrolase family protein [Candidatus Latescibacterota bacterium]|nr:amidohydrolase family protein [Candidatus Latescibacterota bacterium]